MIHSDLLNLGCGTDAVDVFGKRKLKEKCFRQFLPSVMRRRMSHLTQVVFALDRASRTGREEAFVRLLEKASRPLGDVDRPIDSSEIRALSPILHYVESLFARFDSNRNNQLDPAEGWSSYPLIGPFIQKLVGGDPLTDKIQRALFSWLLTEGEPPNINPQSDYALIRFFKRNWVKLSVWTRSQIVWLGRELDMPRSSETATVDSIIKILASFQKVGREKKNRELGEFYLANSQTWSEALERKEPKAYDKTMALLQCSEESREILVRLFAARRSEVFGASERDKELSDDQRALNFSQRLKSFVEADPQLSLLCMPF